MALARAKYYVQQEERQIKPKEESTRKFTLSLSA
jgi:hypothetical protein